jgi:glycosyltransferase involved in cell wall biosynthesis
MNILQLCNKVPYPPKDGGSIAIYNIALGLVEEGNRVDILAIETPKHRNTSKKVELAANLNMRSVFVDTTINPFQLFLNFFFSRTPYNAKRFINDGYRQELIKALKENKYDLVQLEGLYLAPYIADIRKNSTAKIALRSHNIENEIWHRLAKNEPSLLKKQYFKVLAKRVEKFERKIINQYDLLIPITYRDAVVYQKYGNTKPNKVIQTGIPESQISEKINIHKDRKLYFLGSLDWLPNQEGILWFIKNVWPMISHSSTNIEFHVAGRNAPEWFAKKINRPGIIFHGEVENAKAFANDNDIMIIPLLSGGGMRVKMIEAMSQGKIIITTPIGAEGLDIIPNYHAIVAETPEDFAAGLQIVIDNTDFFIKLGENSIRFIRNNYTNRVLASELVKFYHANL